MYQGFSSHISARFLFCLAFHETFSFFLPLEEAGQLVKAEDVEEGNVTWQSYWYYIRAAGGWFVFIFVMLIFVLAIGSQMVTSWWLSNWLSQGSGVGGSLRGFPDVPQGSLC